MSRLKTDSDDWSARSARNSVILGYWTLAWVISMAVAAFGPIFFRQSADLIAVVAILINLGIGIGMIVANARYLRGLDEMQQKIQLEAMALSLGVCLIAGLAYSNLDITNIIAFDAEISHLVILMGLTYAVGVFLGFRKYR